MQISIKTHIFITRYMPIFVSEQIIPSYRVLRDILMNRTIEIAIKQNTTEIHFYSSSIMLLVKLSPHYFYKFFLPRLRNEEWVELTRGTIKIFLDRMPEFYERRSDIEAKMVEKGIELPEEKKEEPETDNEEVDDDDGE